MELVYLWVEEYKNIKKQGFNFSPRFKCKYDEKNRNLEIIDKEETGESYPKDFFGDNINITAIVGENGSGKSNLLEYFKKLDEYIPHFSENYNSSCEQIKNFIYVFNDENGCDFMSNIDDIKSNQPQVTKVKHRYIIDFNHDNNKQSNRNIISSININKKNIIDLILTIYSEYKSYPSHYKKEGYSFKLSTFFYLPTKLEIIPKNMKDVYKNLSIEKIHNNEILAKMYNEEEAIFDSINDNYHLFLIMWYIENIGFDKKILMEKNSLIQQYNSNDTTNEKDKLSEQEFTNYYSNKFLIFKNLTDKEKKIYFDIYKDYFEFDFIDSKNRKYNNLSHGEQNLYGQFLNIFYQLVIEYRERIRDELFFSLDEPDIALHPDWQKKYIQELICLCSKFDKKIHFIITSHSPFILSDIPKENIIFLKDGEQVYPDINTFGANIHTLLSHGFFMKDGLMGEFAKNEINKAIKYLNQKTLSKDEIDFCENIISIIGEPILKRQLQKMLDSKRELLNKEEIDKIKENIKELTEKLHKLESKE